VSHSPDLSIARVLFFSRDPDRKTNAAEKWPEKTFGKFFDGIFAQNDKNFTGRAAQRQ